MDLTTYNEYFGNLNLNTAPPSYRTEGDVLVTPLGRFKLDGTSSYRPSVNEEFSPCGNYVRLIEKAMDYKLGEPVFTRSRGICTITRRTNRSNPVQRVQLNGNSWFNLDEVKPCLVTLHPGNSGRRADVREYYRSVLSHLSPPAPKAKPKVLGYEQSVKGLLIGSDFEIFVKDTRTNEIIPAPLLVPGTKQKPVELKHGTVHPDGIAVEVGCPPAGTYLELKDNLAAILKEVKDTFFPETYYEYVKDSHEARADNIQDFKKHKAENPSWFISGCAPEYCIGVDAGDASMKQKLRCKDKFFTGLHLHFGFTSWDAGLATTRLDCQALQAKVWKNLTVCESIQSSRVSIGGSSRQSYYGGLGSFRAKPYGIEDRSFQGDALFDPNAQELIKTLIKTYAETIKEVL